MPRQADFTCLVGGCRVGDLKWLEMEGERVINIKYQY